MPRGAVSEIPSLASECSASLPCERCRADQAFLRNPDRPADPPSHVKITMADLYAGCGGMTLGMYEASRQRNCGLAVSLAIDCDPAAIETYKSNFPSANTSIAKVEDVFDGSIGSLPT